MCFGIILRLTNDSSNPVYFCLKVNKAPYSDVFSISTPSQFVLRGLEYSVSLTKSIVNITSSIVNGVLSCHKTFSFIVKTIFLPLSSIV